LLMPKPGCSPLRYQSFRSVTTESRRLGRLHSKARHFPIC
jgi:hypothetical protein